VRDAICDNGVNQEAFLEVVILEDSEESKRV
jgi:hypothetical protein